MYYIRTYYSIYSPHLLVWLTIRSNKPRQGGVLNVMAKVIESEIYLFTIILTLHDSNEGFICFSWVIGLDRIENRNVGCNPTN